MGSLPMHTVVLVAYAFAVSCHSMGIVPKF